MSHRPEPSPSGWAMRFVRVDDALEVRVCSHDGPLIGWPDRAYGGEDLTWTHHDPQDETRDLTRWVGTPGELVLWICYWHIRPPRPEDLEAGFRAEVELSFDGEVLARLELTHGERLCVVRRAAA